MSLAPVCAQEEKETLGDKLKKIFTRPLPTPTPRKPHKRRSPSPTATPVSSETPSSSLESASPIPSYGETPLPTESIQAETPRTQYFEPVRPINPGPRAPVASPRIVPAPETMPPPRTASTSPSSPCDSTAIADASPAWEPTSSRSLCSVATGVRNIVDAGVCAAYAA